MTEMNKYPDYDPDGFTSYLHDPFNIKWQNDKVKELISEITKKEGYEPEEHLKSLLNDFTNSKLLHENGLSIYYNTLKDIVNEKKFMGLILYGSTLDPDIYLSKYMTETDRTIDLTVKSVCRFLLRDYMKVEWDSIRFSDLN